MTIENYEMNNQDLLKRITFNPQVLKGKPIIRGLRISVAMVLKLLAKGASIEEILEDYPELEPDDIQAALFYDRHYLVLKLSSAHHFNLFELELIQAITIQRRETNLQTTKVSSLRI